MKFKEITESYKMSSQEIEDTIFDFYDQSFDYNRDGIEKGYDGKNIVFNFDKTEHNLIKEINKFLNSNKIKFIWNGKSNLEIIRN